MKTNPYAKTGYQDVVLGIVSTLPPGSRFDPGAIVDLWGEYQKEGRIDGEEVPDRKQVARILWRLADPDVPARPIAKVPPEGLPPRPRRPGGWVVYEVLHRGGPG